ncbi:MAG: hypothetical protein ABFD24_09470 [Anaerolineaceae bacterium]
MTITCKFKPTSGTRVHIYRASWLVMPKIGDQVHLVCQGLPAGVGRVLRISERERDVLIEVA